jgi:hypothetical protein
MRAVNTIKQVSTDIAIASNPFLMIINPVVDEQDIVRDVTLIPVAIRAQYFSLDAAIAEL